MFRTTVLLARSRLNDYYRQQFICLVDVFRGRTLAAGFKIFVF